MFCTEHFHAPARRNLERLSVILYLAEFRPHTDNSRDHFYYFYNGGEAEYCRYWQQGTGLVRSHPTLYPGEQAARQCAKENDIIIYDKITNAAVPPSFTLYMGLYKQAGGYYLSTAEGPIASLYFQVGNPKLELSKPTYFEKEEDARSAGEQAGYVVKKRSERLDDRDVASVDM